MKRFLSGLLLMLLVLIPMQAQSVAAHASWDLVNQLTDGTPIDGVTYNLYRGPDCSGTGRSVIGTTSAITYDDATVNPFNRYCYWVTALWQTHESDFSVAVPYSSMALMTAPLDGSALPYSAQVFNWELGTAASQYYLQVGTTLGGQEIYSAGQGLLYTTTVWDLPTTGQPVYARLWSEIGGAWLYHDYAYTSCNGCTPTKASITVPYPGSSLSSSIVTFGWNTSLASEYYLQVGLTLGGQELYSSGQGLALSAQVINLPTDAEPIYVRLWTALGTIWLYNDYTYTSCIQCTPTIARMNTPLPGSVLVPPSVTFSWSGSLASEYYLQVGTMPGAQNIYSAGQGLGTSAIVSGLPSGVVIYARLWSRVGTAWLYNDYTYTTQ